MDPRYFLKILDLKFQAHDQHLDWSVGPPGYHVIVEQIVVTVVDRIPEINI